MDAVQHTSVEIWLDVLLYYLLWQYSICDDQVDNRHPEYFFKAKYSPNNPSAAIPISMMLDWNQHDGRRNTTSEAPETCDHDNFFILHDA